MEDSNYVAYAEHVQLADVHYARAVGEMPEMDCQIEAARIVNGLVASPGASICDVGCGAGHYQRSLRKQIDRTFTYCGFERHDIFIERARKAWGQQQDSEFRQGTVFDLPASDREFDITLCSNLLMHVPTIVKPIQELVRITKKHLLIRTMIGDKTYKIQEVYNNSFWPSVTWPASEELLDDGTPREFEYENIWGKDYFQAIVQRFAPRSSISFTEDLAWTPDSIQATRDANVLPNATKIIDGRQVFDYVILPYYWVLVSLP